MRFWLRQCSCVVVAGAFYLALAAGASAQVVVTVDGNVANATIALTDNNGVTYDADVTITFDTPVNLTPESLNLTAELVDPTSAELQSRIGTPPSCLVPPLLCNPGVQIDPRFPVMITVEPIDFAWLFASGFDGGDASGALEFLNTYDFEVHTHDLIYTDESPYRLVKAPIGGPFHDVTNDVTEGSVRVRGRGGEFSQFLVIEDTRPGLTVAALKIVDLNARILLAAIDDGLRLDLLALLAQVDALLLIDLGGALDALDQLIALLIDNEGTNIPNVWTARHDVVNDAGVLEELAFTLRFSMLHPGSPNPP
jgi:uncharacterized protein DUF6689